MLEFLGNLVSFLIVVTICIFIGDIVLYILVRFKEKKKKKQEKSADSPASDDTKKEGVL